MGTSVKRPMMKVRLKKCPICGGKAKLYIWDKDAVETHNWVEVTEVARNLNAGNCKIECSTCNCFFGTNYVWVNGASDFIRLFNTRDGVDGRGNKTFDPVEVEEETAEIEEHDESVNNGIDDDDGDFIC